MAAPQITAVVARGLRTWRVTFSAPVLQVNPAGAYDALNPARYALAAVDVPAVPLTVVAVAAVSATVVDLTLSTDASPGQRYTLTAGDISEAGTVLLASGTVCAGAYPAWVGAHVGFTDACEYAWLSEGVYTITVHLAATPASPEVAVCVGTAGYFGMLSGTDIVVSGAGTPGFTIQVYA